MLHFIPASFGAALLWAILSTAPAFAETGTASWYGPESGSHTANGERFKPDGVSCARRRGKFGTMLRVTDLATGKSILCRLNDRGPAAYTGRAIDLSRGAARALGILSRGTARVRIEEAGR